MRFKKKVVKINGLKFFYWERNSKQKKIIIILHGFPGNHGGLTNMAKGLGDYRLIIPDMPGCGKSGSLKEKHNLKSYSDWLDSFLESLNISQAIILGHSFGSRVALTFAAQYPKKVTKLILVTPVVKMEGLLDRIATLYYEIAEVLPEWLQKIMLSNGLGKTMGDMIVFRPADPRVHSRMIRRDIKEIKNIPPQVTIDLFDEFHKFSLIPLGEKVKKESLIITCNLDHVAPLDSIQELATKFEHGKLEIMQNCGHFVPIEKPLETAGIIKKWLGDFTD